ncbi:RCC1-like domain-containing protein [Spirillospora sp. NPDC048911]|uniref:RCC1-like domain-containing protein n=1 Tax=Spirillospora sp. NPDC048911 TaxID=3364527 RepID=UPI0037115F4D
MSDVQIRIRRAAPLRARTAAAVIAVTVTATACTVSTSQEYKIPQAHPAPPPGAAAREAGEVWTAGLNGDGQLGRAPGKPMDAALAPAAGAGGRGRLRAVAVAAGGRHSLALVSGGRVAAWGANDKGQLGDGTRIGRSEPVAVRAPGGSGLPLTGAVAIAADTDFSMALLRNGSVVTWGAGTVGQRGIGRTGRTGEPPDPTVVLRPDGRGPLTRVSAIAADGNTALALLKDGTVVGWGSNDFGMVGDGSSVDRALPRAVRGPEGEQRLAGVTQIATGGQHGLARLRDGTAVSWGRNDYGQLGDGTLTNRLEPVRVSGPHGLPVLRDIVTITAGEQHNFALRGDGGVVAWGNNTAGQLGDGTTNSSPRPVQVVGVQSPRLRGVVRIVAGEAYGVATLTDGSVLTWGSGSKGQLGSGAKAPRTKPGTVVLAGGRPAGRVLDVGAGRRHLALLMRW